MQTVRRVGRQVRKAGELLAALAEQSKEGQRRENQYTVQSYHPDKSALTPYRTVLTEVKLRAERKAGELLQQLERDPLSKGGDAKSAFQAEKPISEYRAVLTDSDIAPTTAHRWQTVQGETVCRERNAVELLAQLAEQTEKGGDRRSENFNNSRMESLNGNTPYRTVLPDTNIAPTTMPITLSHNSPKARYNRLNNQSGWPRRKKNAASDKLAAAWH